MEFQCTKSELFSAIMAWRQDYENNTSSFEGNSLDCSPHEYAESTVNYLTNSILAQRLNTTPV